MKRITILIIAVLLTQFSFSQTMTVHKRDQTTVDFQLSQIDSITFSIESSITLPGRAIKGLAYDSGILWAIATIGDSTKIYRINPDNGQILLESSSQLNWNGRGITVGAGFLWIVDPTADVIRKLDPSNFSQLASFNTPGSEPNGITFDGTNLWLTDPFFQKIYQLSTTGGVISYFNIPNAFRNGLEWEGTGMWTNTDTNKVSFYTTTGTITTTKTLEQNIYTYIYDIAIGDGKVYISNGGDKIYIEIWQP
jgi:glutamine cyclotransferase